MTAFLDLFSTSQTKQKLPRRKGRPTDKRIYDSCMNNAPYFAYQIEGKKWGVVQGCCNDWNCPRCGQQRAREEYGRIVSGAREIAKTNKLYFLTITCRGKDCTIDEAEKRYLEWTNRFVTRIRTAQKRSGGEWFYASVTERQARAHPHSHYLTTYCPPDAVVVAKGEWKYYATVGLWFKAKHDTLQSEICERSCADSGLGYQYDLSRVKSVEAGSRYVSKYLFKESIFQTVWPKGWRRVRYSNSWPKLPDLKGNGMILLTAFDWLALAKNAVRIVTKDDGARLVVERALRGNDVIIQ